MARAPGIQVPSSAAEALRRQLLAAGLLREDLKVARHGDDVVFPVRSAPGGMRAVAFEFEERPVRARDYADLLPETMRADAPRAHDVLGDIVVVKVPRALWEDRAVLGEALLRFHGARAAFHDGGVQGPFRTRALEHIAGQGGSETSVAENGVRLHIDPAAAYFSPRLADERARIVAQVRRGERVIDLFGGVAPLGVQLARTGCEVVSVDLNPAATALATRNAGANGVSIDVRTGDAREVATDLPPADRVVMNLPHDAKRFLDVALPLVRPGGWLHHHEILPKDAVDARIDTLAKETAALGRPATVRTTRHVRDYSRDDAHIAFDLEVP